MKVNEIITLLNAGYTKDEIDAMDQRQENKLPDSPEPDPAYEPEEIQTEEAVKPHDAEPASVPADDRYNELLDAFNRLTSTIQQSNIANSHIEGSDAAGRTAKDALAEILVPPRKERKR